SWFDQFKDRITEWKYGLLPFLGFLGIAIFPLMLQPDSGTLVLIALVAFTIYWMRGAPWKHIGLTFLIGTLALGTYVFMNPHIIDRIETFKNPNQDPYGSSYQIRQSRIAIGSGKLYGRGLGQSVHKFGPYLPESSSDSIFAIFAEEYGFLGSVILVTLYSLFGFFGFKIARRAPTVFAQNLVIGIILLIVVQVFFNIAAISGLVPLSGLPLIFMSNGGTALIVTLAQLGIVLNISRYAKQSGGLARKRIIQ
ncbi:FtsW/RodA/SpoVE family cell cycle protein, partial [Patescibacteria group bacterium]|nr:FtsW/RodA/SpoVE family cell cycle protein [Patescibacteria group bacterium]